MQPPPANPRLAGRGKSTHPGEPKAPAGLPRWVWWIVLGLVLAVTTSIRLRLLSLPLERDEGEYAYGGQLLLQGLPLYRDLYTMKWPGTHAAYALIMAVFGQSAAGIHAGLILANLATAVLVFVLARRLCGDMGGVVATGTYALLSINPPMLGLSAHATHFVVLPALAGILLLHRLEERTSSWRIFFAGLLLGLAALMKQSGVAFGLFAGFWISWQEWLLLPRDRCRLARRLGLLTLGGALPFLVTCLLIASAGDFGRFWFWTFQYAREYAGLSTLKEGLSRLQAIGGSLLRTAPAPLAFAFLGLIPLFQEPSPRRLGPFVLGLALFSLLAVCPGWYFRGHYFLVLLPAAGLLAGLAAQAGHDLLARRRSPAQGSALLLLLFSGMALWTLFLSRDILFQLPPRQVWHSHFTPAFFPEAVEVGDYLRLHCPPEGRIAVLGSEPEICFYSRRRSATGYIYMYPLMEPQPYAAAMQREMIREIEAANPDYVVLVYDASSWVTQPDSAKMIFDWFASYRENHLKMVAWLEMTTRQETDYHWSATDGSHGPRSRRWLAIYENKRSPAGAETQPGKE